MRGTGSPLLAMRTFRTHDQRPDSVRRFRADRSSSPGHGITDASIVIPAEAGMISAWPMTGRTTVIPAQAHP